MKILFVEDTPRYIEMFLKQLSTLGEVTVFKSSNAARKWLHDNQPALDLVVCDHNILRFEAETNTRATGDEIYHELRWGDYPELPFIHFSAEPCPENYEAKGDANFYSLKKDDSVNLLKFIEEKKLKK